MSAPVTTPGQRFPPGTSLALRPTRRRQGHLVSWLQRGQLPPPPLLPPGMRGSWKPGAEPSVSGNRCKTTTPLGWGHHSAGDSARPFAVSVGPRGQCQGPARPPLGPGCGSGLGPSPCRALGWEALPAAGTHIWLAGAQRCPINAWPGPAPPRCVLTLRAVASTQAAAKTRSDLGGGGTPGPGRMRDVRTDSWEGPEGTLDAVQPWCRRRGNRPGRPGQDAKPGLPAPSSVTLPSGSVPTRLPPRHVSDPAGPAAQPC